MRWRRSPRSCPNAVRRVGLRRESPGAIPTKVDSRATDDAVPLTPPAVSHAADDVEEEALVVEAEVGEVVGEVGEVVADARLQVLAEVAIECAQRAAAG